MKCVIQVKLDWLSIENGKVTHKSFCCRFYQLHAQPSSWHLQPWPLQHEPGHEATIMQLFHCLITQHLPDGWPADVTVQSGHVRLGPAGWLPLCRRLGVIFTQQTVFSHESKANPFASSNHFLVFKGILVFDREWGTLMNVNLNYSWLLGRPRWRTNRSPWIHPDLQDSVQRCHWYHQQVCLHQDGVRWFTHKHMVPQYMCCLKHILGLWFYWY